MNNEENISVEEEINRMSQQIEHLINNLDNITEDDIDPETLALAKQAIESNQSRQLTCKEIAERFFPEE